MEDTNTSTPPTLEEMYVMARQKPKFRTPGVFAFGRSGKDPWDIFKEHNGRSPTGFEWEYRAMRHEAALRPPPPPESAPTIPQNRDIFSNPAIPYEDCDDSYTPDALEGMCEQYEKPSKRYRLRFFDLPREIRDSIYSQVHLFTPEGGFPMDFASCVDCLHERFDYKAHSHYDPDEPWLGIMWFVHKWRRIRTQLKNSIVSRQFYKEAEETVYRQPFRFTGDCGWIILHYFLEKLGPTKSRLLKDITVCHPGFSSLPEVNPPRQYDDGSLLTGDYNNLFDEHMRAFRFGPGLRRPYPAMTHDCEWNGPQQPDTTVRLLSQATSLTKLTLTLPQFQFPDEQFSFHKLENHPIHKYIWPQGRHLTRSIVHLVSSRHDCHDQSRLQPCLREIYSEPLEDGKPDLGNWDAYYFPNSFAMHNGAHVMPLERATQAHSFFEAVKTDGWVVKQQLYDERGHYPVKAGEGCVNAKMCRWLKEVEEDENLGYHCPGTKEESIAHVGLEYMDRWDFRLSASDMTDGEEIEGEEDAE